MDPNKKIKQNDWYMERGPPIMIDAEFECINIPKDDTHQKPLFTNKPKAVGKNYI